MGALTVSLAGTTTMPLLKIQCLHLEELRYKKYQELSKIMLDILITNCNFITRYFFCEGTKFNFKKKKVTIQLLGRTNLKSSEEMTAHVSVTPRGGWDETQNMNRWWKS